MTVNITACVTLSKGCITTPVMANVLLVSTGDVYTNLEALLNIHPAFRPLKV